MTLSCRPNSPAKKPLSQACCSGVNGALSGMNVGIGGRGVHVHWRASARPWLARRRARGGARRRGSSHRGAGAMREIGLKQALDRARRIFARHVAIDFAAERRVSARSRRRPRCIAFDLVALLVRLRLCRPIRPMSPIEVLRAGMMAAGEMDVDRRVERRRASRTSRAISTACSLVSGGGEFAAGIAGAGDEAGADRHWCQSRGRAPRSRAFAASTLSVGTPEISRFCQTVSRMIAVAEVARDRRRGRASARPSACRPARRRRSSSGLPASADERRDARCDRTADAARSRCGNARQLAAELFFDRGEEFLDAPGVEHIFQPRLGAVGAVAVLDEDAHDRVGDLAGSPSACRARRCRGRNRDGR